MRKLFSLLLLAALAVACKDAAGPKPLHDPFVVVRVVNDLDTSYALYVRIPSYPDSASIAFVGVLDLPQGGGVASSCLMSFSSIADTTHVYLTAFRSTPSVSGGDFAAGDSARMRTTGLIDPFIGQEPHGASPTDPLRWVWVLSTDSLARDTSTACR